jgi:hypothetical protein
VKGVTKLEEESLIKSYRRLDTTSTMQQDAEEAFSRIIPYIQGKYPFIRFDPPHHPSRDYNGDYYVVGAYEGKFLWIFPDTKFITLFWGKTDYPHADNCDEYVPQVQFSTGSSTYIFSSLGDLEKLLADNIKHS